MPLPLIVAGIALGSIVGDHYAKKYYRDIELQRFDASYSKHGVSNNLAKPPSEYCQRASNNLIQGSIVCCEVFGVLDHTGIWIDHDIIIEFSNSGLVKAVSANRFLKERSGSHIYVANDRNGNSIAVNGISQRALERVYTFESYDLKNNNCHNFVAQCISNKNNRLTTFSSLNDLIALTTGQNIYWDKVKV